MFVSALVVEIRPSDPGWYGDLLLSNMNPMPVTFSRSSTALHPGESREEGDS